MSKLDAPVRVPDQRFSCATSNERSDHPSRTGDVGQHPRPQHPVFQVRKLPVIRFYCTIDSTVLYL